MGQLHQRAHCPQPAGGALEPRNHAPDAGVPLGAQGDRRTQGKHPQAGKGPTETQAQTWTSPGTCTFIRSFKNILFGTKCVLSTEGREETCQDVDSAFE